MDWLGTFRRERPLKHRQSFEDVPMFRLLRNLFLLRQAWKMVKRRR